MDPTFLAGNIRTLVGLNLWLVTPKAPEKTTPFQLTIEHYDNLLAETKKAEQLKKAELQKKARLAILEDQAKRNKEDRICQRCFSLFTYYYPLGQSSPFKEIIPSGEMDPDILCHICKDLLCTICKAKMCLEIEEIPDQTCAACIKHCTCCGKILQKTEDQTLDLCTACNALNNTTATANAPVKCLTCDKIISRSSEIRIRMCRQCLADSLLDSDAD
jgi:hypothetical protein